MTQTMVAGLGDEHNEIIHIYWIHVWILIRNTCNNAYNFNRTSIILTNRRCIKENIIESLERMRRYLKKMKPTDDYVRGYKDAKLMMDETLKEAIEYIKKVEDA